MYCVCAYTQYIHYARLCKWEGEKRIDGAARLKHGARAGGYPWHAGSVAAHNLYRSHYVTPPPAERGGGVGKQHA